jgi:DNA-binding MarR family transcriptional regulator
MTQLDLLEPVRARRKDPETSHKAASRVNEFAFAHYALILEALDTGDLTIHEIAQKTGLDSVQVARRLAELEKKGLAEPTEETRLSPSGRPCRVWRAV